MILGTLGPLVFVSSTNYLNTFSDLKRKRKRRYADHQIIGQKPQLQDIGQDNDSITLKMRFELGLTVLAPQAAILALGQMQERSWVIPLVIGPHYFGFFIIEDLEEDFKSFDGMGRMIVLETSVTLKEYDKKIDWLAEGKKLANKAKSLVT